MRQVKDRHKVSIIIPNYDGARLLEKNLPKVIKAAQNKKNKILEIIVVDDASKDESADLVLSKFTQVRLIKHKVNRGFSASVNTGARSSKGNILCLLNTDVSPSKDFLIAILPHFKNENVFAVSLNEKGYSWAHGFFEDGFVIHKPGRKAKKTHSTFWVNGGSGVFRRDYWMKLGGMDEKLFSPFYWEDVDLSYRALKRGFRLLWEPKAKVIHHHESTIGKISRKYRQRIQERNQLIFIWKNLTSPILFRKHVLGVFRRVSLHPGYLIIVLMALRKIKGVVKVRKREKKESKVSDEAIFARFG